MSINLNLSKIDFCVVKGTNCGGGKHETQECICLLVADRQTLAQLFGFCLTPQVSAERSSLSDVRSSLFPQKLTCIASSHHTRSKAAHALCLCFLSSGNPMWRLPGCRGAGRRSSGGGTHAPVLRTSAGRCRAPAPLPAPPRPAWMSSYSAACTASVRLCHVSPLFINTGLCNRAAREREIKGNPHNQPLLRLAAEAR